MIRQPLFYVLSLFTVVLAVAQTPDEKAPAAQDKPKPLKALLVTGGCCHDYKFQAAALTQAVEKQAEIEWTVVNKGGNGTEAEIDLYDEPNWAKGYDVVVHNECFADTKDPAYIRKITAAHKGGVPAVVIHCAMHTYRATDVDDWREFLGVTSRRHDHQSHYPVKPVAKAHPVMEGFPEEWVTPMDELYIIEKAWPKTTPLAISKSEKDGSEQPVIWVNDYHGTRVFGTTFGHTSETFSDPTFLNVVTRGVLWAAGKVN